VAQQPLVVQGGPHYRGFTITLRHTTLNRTPLDEWSAQHRDLYLTTHNIHKIQISLHTAGLEPKVPAKTSGHKPTPLDRANIGIGHYNIDPYFMWQISFATPSQYFASRVSGRMICEPTKSDKWYLLDKVITLFLINKRVICGKGSRRRYCGKMTWILNKHFTSIFDYFTQSSLVNEVGVLGNVRTTFCGLLGNYTASCGNYLPTFRDNVSVPSSWVKIPRWKESFHLVHLVCVSGCHRYLWFFDAPPEDGNLIADTNVGVTNILFK
jgi:hypothetical protein